MLSSDVHKTLFSFEKISITLKVDEIHEINYFLRHRKYLK